MNLQSINSTFPVRSSGKAHKREEIWSTGQGVTESGASLFRGRKDERNHASRYYIQKPHIQNLTEPYNAAGLVSNVFHNSE